jgi:hypothetical protein
MFNPSWTSLRRVHNLIGALDNHKLAYTGQRAKDLKIKAHEEVHW